MIKYFVKCPVCGKAKSTYHNYFRCCNGTFETAKYVFAATAERKSRSIEKEEKIELELENER